MGIISDWTWRWANSDHVWTNMGQLGSQSGQFGPLSVNLGPNLARFRPCWAMSNGFGPSLQRMELRVGIVEKLGKTGAAGVTTFRQTANAKDGGASDGSFNGQRPHRTLWRCGRNCPRQRRRRSGMPQIKLHSCRVHSGPSRCYRPAN